jgi:hypothetical protein
MMRFRDCVEEATPLCLAARAASSCGQSEASEASTARLCIGCRATAFMARRCPRVRGIWRPAGGDAYAQHGSINTAPGGRVESDLPMKTKTYFAFRIDLWDDAGDNLVEHLAGLDDYGMAVAAYWAAVESRPKDKITLRQGIRVVVKN